VTDGIASCCVPNAIDKAEQHWSGEILQRIAEMEKIALIFRHRRIIEVPEPAFRPPKSRRSGNTRANLSAKPRRSSAIARSITPPFEVRRPPSKAAVTFLARTAGNEKGRIVS